MPRRYKWVLIHSGGERLTYLVQKPRRVTGGYLHATGRRWVGTAVTLLTRKEFDRRHL